MLLWKDKPNGDGEGGGIVRGEDGSGELVQTLSPGKGDEGLASTLSDSCLQPSLKSPFINLLHPSSFSCYLSCLHFLNACQIFDYIQEIFKRMEAPLREGVTSAVRKDQALPHKGLMAMTWKPRWTKEDIAYCHSLFCKLGLDFSFTIHWLDDQGHIWGISPLASVFLICKMEVTIVLSSEAYYENCVNNVM